MSDNKQAATEEQRMNAMVQSNDRNERDESAVIAALRNSLFPGASDSSIEMVLAYCKAAGLDPMTKPVHIVPMSVKKPGSRDQYEYRDVVMPGIELYRTKAHRTGAYAGKDRAVFGPDITMTLDRVEVTFPEWCEVTVYRIVQGHRVPFTETVWWLEAYATVKRDSEAPNAMWRKRTRGQLAKCAEAAALRAGFPEIGAQPTADEMAGKALIYDEPPAIPIQRITPEQVKELDKLLVDTGSDKAKFLKYVQADKLEDIQASAFADAVTMIESAARRRKLESVLADLREEVSASDLDTALAALDASDLDDKGKASIRKQLQAEMPA